MNKRKRKINADKQPELFPVKDTTKTAKVSWFSKAIDILRIREESGWPDVFGKAVCDSMPEKVVTVVSLFSGAGGLDIGFHDAGFKILECNEIVQLFAETLILNSKKGGRFEGTKVHCKDIKDYVPDTEHVDFVIGGPPCQTFSAAGARAAGVMGTDDERGNLFIEYARILKLLNPKGFLFENVYRIVGAQGGKPWQHIQQTFRDLGYNLFWRIVDAADYGVPQFRERLIIVGLKEGVFLFPEPSHGPDSADNRPYYTAGNAVSNIPNLIVKPGDGLTGRHGSLLVDIPPGLNYSFYTERMGHPQPIFAWRSKFSDYLYKADPETPVRSIKAQGGQYTGPLSWENRYFTVEELQRLQSFPDDYKIKGGRLKVIQQLGNSVPPQLARILAMSVMNQVFAKKYPFEIAYLPEHAKLGFRKRKSDLTDIYRRKAKEALADAHKKYESYDPNPIVCQGEGSIRLGNNLSYEVSEEKTDDFDYFFRYSLESTKWFFDMFEKSKHDLLYAIEITLPLFFKLTGQALSIEFKVYSQNNNSLLALWKILEYYLREKYWKDDLVQVFGYYQYKRDYSIDIKPFTEYWQDGNYWQVAQKIMSGNCVGKITSMEILLTSWQVNMSEDDLKKAMESLKDNGYEIRNHNTNRQIKKGKYLIPYPFATLNERSLQRLTQL